ncbi:MAG TPA: hypothetical protein VEC15_03830 [Actinomycetota bacterium]|nr:hypothetical protein [Actinomycetota bacterium]
MATLETSTLAVTIEAPFDRVVSDLADPATHPEWATEFFAGPAQRRADGTYEVEVPSMGGIARMSVDVDAEHGVVDLFLAPGEAPFGPAVPVRVVRNGDGVDVLFTLARFPGMTDEQWKGGLAGMRHELENLKSRHESR